MSWIFCCCCFALSCDGSVFHLRDSPQCPNDTYLLKQIPSCNRPEGLTT